MAQEISTPSWNDIESHPDFQTFDQDTRKKIRSDYFDEHIATHQDYKSLDQSTQQRAQTDWNTNWMPAESNDQAAVDATIKASGGDTLTGLKRGVQNVEAMGYGATALAGAGLKKIGVDKIGQAAQDFGMEGYRRNVEEAKKYPKRYSFKDVYTGKAGVGGAIDWAQGTLGELIPSMAEAAVGTVMGAAAGTAVEPGAGTLGGGVLGAFAGRTILKKSIEKGVQQAVKKGLSKEAESQVRKAITRDALKKLGGKIGMGAAVLPMESGGMYAELLETKGIDAPETALLFGSLATAMEYAGGNSKLVDTFIDALSKGGQGLAKKSARELLTNIPQEALQEGGQEIMGILNTVANTDEKFLTAENIEQVIESMGAGAIGGGAGAVVSSSMNTQSDATNDYEKNIKEKFDNITSQGTDKIPASIEALNQEIDKNTTMLQDEELLDALAAESGNEVIDLRNFLINQNEFNKDLQTRLQTELDNPGQSEELVDDVPITSAADVIKQRQAVDAAKQADKEKQIQSLDNRIQIVRKTYFQITDPTKRNKVGERLDALVKERQAIIDDTQQGQAFTKIPITPDTEKQALYDELFGTANLYELGNGNNNAQASAEVLVPPNTSSFIDEQQLAEPSQVNDSNQVSMTELENQLEVNNQQLDALAEQINNTTDPNERIALQQEGSVLYAENAKLQADWDKQYQEQNQATEPEANAEFQVREIQKNQDAISWSPTRLKWALSYGAYPDGSTKSEVAWVNPQDFINATTPSADMRQSIKDRAGNLNIDKLQEETQTPFLYIKDGQIVGHEGRHRMAALADAGYTSVPIVLDYRKPEKREKIDSKNFDGQSFYNYDTEKYNFGNSITVQNVIPLTFKNKKIIQEEMNKASSAEFQVGNQKQTNQLSLTDIQSMFPEQQVHQAADGTISVKFKNGKGATFKSIQDAGQGFIKVAIETGQMSKNGKILGITVGNDVVLDANYADDKTMWHENKHVLDNLGMITDADNSALNREFNKLRKTDKLNFELSTHKDPKQRMKENRANMFAQIMTDRAAYRGDSKFKAMIQRVLDFINQVWNYGNQTISGLAREVESGKIYARNVNGKSVNTNVPQTETSANKWYSQVAKAIDSSNMKAAKAGRWYNQIMRYPGIKSAEMEWSGLTEFLKSNPQKKITKQELQAWFEENQVQLEEVVLHDRNIIKKLANKTLDETKYHYDMDYDETLYIVDNEGVVPIMEELPLEDRKILNDSLNKVEEIYNSEAKYLGYATEGGTDYKEFILTWPNKKTNYIGDHWPDVKNPVVAVRTQIRTRDDGSKFLHVEEIQSDWDQEGQKRGFVKKDISQSDILTERQEAAILNMNLYSTGYYYAQDNQGNWLPHNPNNQQIYLEDAPQTVQNIVNETDFESVDFPTNQKEIEKNPWIEKSTILAMKRMIRYAAENNLDAIAWSGADIQTDRWGSEGFSWDKNADGTFTLYGVPQADDLVVDRTERNGLIGEGAKTGRLIENREDVSEALLDIMEAKQQLYSPNKWNQYIDKQTDKLWKRMQKANSTTLQDLNNSIVLNEISKNYDEKVIQEYAKKLNKKLSSYGLNQYHFIFDKDNRWNLVKNNQVVSAGKTPQKAFDRENPLGSYFPRAEAFEEVYDKKLYATLKKEFGKNQWGKPKFSFIEQDGLKLPSMEITSRMKSKALREGMPMFNAQNDSMAAKALTGQLEKTDISTPAFNNWFEQSVAKKADGSPIELYHGTDQVFETFTKDGEVNTNHATSGLGHFFTTNKKTADNYGQHTLPVYLKMNNPYKMSLQEAQALESTTASEQRQQKLRDAGYDSVIIETGSDPYVVVFDSGQVKSVYNQGDFNATDNIYFETREATEQPKQKLTDAQYGKSFKRKNNLLQDIAQITKIRGHELKLLADKLTGTISTRLKNANPMLRDKMRRLDFDTSQKIIKALHTAKPLLDKTKEMTPADKHAWDLARKQADTVKINQIATRYGMLEDQEKLRDVMNDLRQQAIDVGYDVGFIDDYWPRIIKDTEGFLQATQGISERPAFTDAIRLKAKQLGITVNELTDKFPDVKADVISNMILGKTSGIGGPGNIQGRVFDTIAEDYEKFYMDSDAALMQYIYSMTKKIEARKFFGKVPPKIQAHKIALAKANTELTKIGDTNADRKVELNDAIALHEEALNKYKSQRDYTENIGAYINELMVKGDLNKKDERVVKDILNARFNEHGTTGVVNAYKNMAYIDVMGNVVSAMTQIADLVWGAYVGKVWTPKGFSNTVQNTIAAAMGKSKMTKEDLGIERIAQEFADGTTLGNAVSKVFNVVGLTKMDSIGKEVLINNALMNYQAQIKTAKGMKALEKEIRPLFGAETKQVIKDLSTDTHSDNVKMLVYSKLLDFQPAALSEMPEYYLKGGNGRIFYMLKTYTLKQMDVFRNEVIHELKSGDPQRVQQGLKNMTALLSMLTLSNAGVDELKDFTMGRETRFKDNVIENFLTLGGASRYMQMQVTREGIGSAMAQKILPPFKFINAIGSDLREKIVTGDIDKGLRSLESIPSYGPIGGKLAYWHFGRGSQIKKTLNEKDFSKDNKRFNKFKRQAEKSGDPRLFYQTNKDEFRQMQLFQNIQSSLNGNQATINKLKKLEQTPNVVKRIGQLENQRKLFYDSYFKRAESLTIQ